MTSEITPKQIADVARLLREDKVDGLSREWSLRVLDALLDAYAALQRERGDWERAAIWWREIEQQRLRERDEAVEDNAALEKFLSTLPCECEQQRERCERCDLLAQPHPGAGLLAERDALKATLAELEANRMCPCNPARFPDYEHRTGCPGGKSRRVGR